MHEKDSFITQKNTMFRKTTRTRESERFINKKNKTNTMLRKTTRERFTFTYNKKKKKNISKTLQQNSTTRQSVVCIPKLFSSYFHFLFRIITVILYIFNFSQYILQDE